MKGFIAKWRDQRDRGGESPPVTVISAHACVTTLGENKRGERGQLPGLATLATSISVVRGRGALFAKSSSNALLNQVATLETLATPSLDNSEREVSAEVTALAHSLREFSEVLFRADRWFDIHGPDDPQWLVAGQRVERVVATLGELTERLQVLGYFWDGLQAVQLDQT